MGIGYVRELITADTLKRVDWPLTLALAVTGFVLVGICAVAVGLLFDPLMTEYRWKNGAVSGLATVYSLAALLSGPIAGWLIDRHGAKVIMALGVVLVALGFFGLRWCGGIVGFYLAFVVIGVGYGGAFFLASTKLIAARMRERNLGMGIWMGAGSSGAALCSVTINWVIRAYGWRNMSSMAALLIAATIPVILLVIANDPAAPSQPVPGLSRAPSVPLRLLVSSRFLLLAGAGALAAFGMSAIYFHTVPILIKAGYSVESAGAILGASWILSALGSLVTGALSSAGGTRSVLAGSLLCGAVGTVGLMGAQSAQWGVIAVAAFIILWGATANAINQFLPLLLAEHYGTTYLATLVGVQGALMGLVGSFAPLATGSLYDHYANYWVAILASIITTSIALTLVLMLKAGTSNAEAIQESPACSTAS